MLGRRFPIISILFFMILVLTMQSCRDSHKANNSNDLASESTENLKKEIEDKSKSASRCREFFLGSKSIYLLNSNHYYMIGSNGLVNFIDLRLLDDGRRYSCYLAGVGAYEPYVNVSINDVHNLSGKCTKKTILGAIDTYYKDNVKFQWKEEGSNLKVYIKRRVDPDCSFSKAFLYRQISNKITGVQLESMKNRFRSLPY